MVQRKCYTQAQMVRAILITTVIASLGTIGLQAALTHILG